MSKTPPTRPVLADVKKVLWTSIPRSLRHNGPNDALVEARSLVLFLQDVARLEHVNREGDPIENHEGLMLVYDLILDKIEIGCGVYKFPYGGHGDDLPALTEREEW